MSPSTDSGSSRGAVPSWPCAAEVEDVRVRHDGRPRPAQPAHRHRRTPPSLGELTYRALRAWLDHRRTTWPRTPNRHVLISGKTALTAEARKVPRTGREDASDRYARAITEAQAYATLPLAAATALHSVTDSRAWAEVAGSSLSGGD